MVTVTERKVRTGKKERPRRQRQILVADSITVTEHPFYMYKIVKDIGGETFLLEMMVPQGSKVHAASYKKVRANRVVPTRIWKISDDGSKVTLDRDVIYVIHKGSFGPPLKYVMGKVVCPNWFSPYDACSAGIHGYPGTHTRELCGYLPSEIFWRCYRSKLSREMRKVIGATDLRAPLIGTRGSR